MFNVKSLVWGAAALLSLTAAQADDIFKGTRGPTSFQVDTRFSYSSSNSKTITSTSILKYWDNRMWGYVSFPYRSCLSPSHYHGIGDISVGAGPRFTKGAFHGLPYFAATFPTGASRISNERYDLKLGGFLTYITDDRDFEFDCAAERIFTGINGQPVPDEIYAGFVAGGKLGKNTRAAAGTTSSRRDDGSSRTDFRIVGRYTISKRLHFELIGDKTISAHDFPERTSVTVLARYNI